MAVDRSPASSGRRRSRKKGPRTRSPLPLAQELDPLPPGTEVEVRIDGDGFYGSWYEATVVGFYPAAGRRCPARYTVTYAYLLAEDGADSVAPSHVRPRPPGPGSSPAPAPPRFLLHDFVEVFDCRGWWSGIVFAPVTADSGSPVTVAFPITREVLSFPRNLVRPRRDYVGGEWVPSQAVIAVQPKGGVRVYKAGEKVELMRERDAYGDSWFPATVAKPVDKLSYIVEYLDDQVGGGKASVYRHWQYIRPAEYHHPRESKVLLCPGTAVEVYCDGAWSQGVVHRVIRERCEYEVSVDGEEAEQLLTKAVCHLRPLYMWNGRHWTIPSDKRQANLRQQSASQKHPSSSVDGTSSGEEHSNDSESLTAKKSRREAQQQELISDGGSEHASVSEMDTSLCTSSKFLETLNTCSLSKGGLLYALTEHTAPPVASNGSSNSCPPQSEKNGVSMLAHKIASICSMSKNGLICASSGNSALPDESAPNVIGETELSRGSEMMPPNGQINTPVCGRNADATCDMLSTPEVREQNIASSLKNQQTQERPFFVKALSVKKGISKNKRAETHPKAHQGKNDASDHVQIQLMENRNSSGKEIISALSASPECQKTSASTQQVSIGTNSGSDTEVARKEGTGLLDKEVAATINMICQENRNAEATQVTKSKPLTEIPILSFDLLVQQDGSKADERPTLPIQNAESSEFTTDNIDQVPFVKKSPLWPLIEGMHVFKKLPQQPHFCPLRKCPPTFCERTALGLMMTFVSSVEDIGKSSIADSIASFESKMDTLDELDKNGFDVKLLQSKLSELLKIKSSHISYVTEKDQLKAQLLEKTTSLSQIDERLDKKEQTIAKLEEELGRVRLEAQKLAEEKEHEEEELSGLKVANSSVEEACGHAELQFQSVLTDLRRKSLA